MAHSFANSEASSLFEAAISRELAHLRDDQPRDASLTLLQLNRARELEPELEDSRWYLARGTAQLHYQRFDEASESLGIAEQRLGEGDIPEELRPRVWALLGTATAREGLRIGARARLEAGLRWIDRAVEAGADESYRGVADRLRSVLPAVPPGDGVLQQPPFDASSLRDQEGQLGQVRFNQGQLPLGNRERCLARAPRMLEKIHAPLMAGRPDETLFNASQWLGPLIGRAGTPADALDLFDEVDLAVLALAGAAACRKGQHERGIGYLRGVLAQASQQARCQPEYRWIFTLARDEALRVAAERSFLWVNDVRAQPHLAALAPERSAPPPPALPGIALALTLGFILLVLLRVAAGC